MGISQGDTLPRVFLGNVNDLKDLLLCLALFWRNVLILWDLTSLYRPASFQRPFRIPMMAKQILEAPILAWRFWPGFIAPRRAIRR